MKKWPVLIAVGLLSLSISELSLAQETLDSTRADYLLAVFKQLGHPFLHACRAFYAHSYDWPQDSASLVSFAIRKGDSLIVRRFKHFGVTRGKDGSVELTFELKPIKSSLIQGENPSLVLAFLGEISMSPPPAYGSNIVVYSVDVVDASLLLPDNTARRVNHYYQVFAEILPAKY